MVRWSRRVSRSSTSASESVFSNTESRVYKIEGRTHLAYHRNSSNTMSLNTLKARETVEQRESSSGPKWDEERKRGRERERARERWEERKGWWLREQARRGSRTPNGQMGVPAYVKAPLFGSPSAGHLSMSRRERRSHSNTPAKQPSGRPTDRPTDRPTESNRSIAQPNRDFTLYPFRFTRARLYSYGSSLVAALLLETIHQRELREAR